MENVASRTVSSVRLAVGLFKDEALVRIDSSCFVEIEIPPGATADVNCPIRIGEMNVAAVVTDATLHEGAESDVDVVPEARGGVPEARRMSSERGG